MTLAFHAERVVVQEGGAFCPPSLRAVERTGDRITLAGVVPITLLLFAPASCTVDRWTDGHGVDPGDDDVSEFISQRIETSVPSHIVSFRLGMLRPRDISNSRLMDG
jgi:hypothetical protein